MEHGYFPLQGAIFIECVFLCPDLEASIPVFCDTRPGNSSYRINQLIYLLWFYWLHLIFNEYDNRTHLNGDSSSFCVFVILYLFNFLYPLTVCTRISNLTDSVLSGVYNNSSVSNMNIFGYRLIVFIGFTVFLCPDFEVNIPI